MFGWTRIHLRMPAKLHRLTGRYVKGTVSRVFSFKFFSWVIFPQAPENLRRYSQVKVHHRYQRHRWQTLGTISDCWQPKVSLKEKTLSINSTTQRYQKEITKTFPIEDFFHLPPVSMTLVVHLELRISPRIFEKIRNGPHGIIRGLGETDPCRKPEVGNLVTLSLEPDAVLYIGTGKLSKSAKHCKLIC